MLQNYEEKSSFTYPIKSFKHSIWLKKLNWEIFLISHFSFLILSSYLCIRFRINTSTGEMVEWSITVVLKTTVPRGTGGSNPSLSANDAENQRVTNLPPVLHPFLVKLGVIFCSFFEVG